jgi:chromosomal replication initiation ATPase DnaA
MNNKVSYYYYPGLNTNSQIQIRRKYNDKNTCITADEIIHIVADVFNVSKEDIISSSRMHNICRARTAAQALMRHFTLMTLQEITHAVRRENHATAIHHINQSKNWVNTYLEYSDYYKRAFEYCSSINKQYQHNEQNTSDIQN